MPIQPIGDAAPRHAPPDAHVLGSSSSQSQIDSLLAAYAFAIASHQSQVDALQAAHAHHIVSLQSQIDMLKHALGVHGQTFNDS